MKTTCLSSSFFHPLLRLCLAGIFIVIASACGGGGSAGNTPQATSVSISLPNMKQPAGSSVTMPVTLNTKADVTAMQFDIDYDSTGISLNPAGIAATLSNGQRVYAAPVSASRLRIIIAPTTDLQPIADGDIVPLPFLLSGSAKGEYAIKVNNTVVAGADMKNMNDYRIQDGMISVQ